MALAVVRVGQTVRGLFVVRLTQQGVEAVVQAGAQAHVSGVAGAVQAAIQVLPRQKRLLVVVVVVSRRAELVLVQGGQHGLVCVQGTPAIQAARAAVSGHLESRRNTPLAERRRRVVSARLPPSPCIHPAGW